MVAREVTTIVIDKIDKSSTINILQTSNNTERWPKLQLTIMTEVVQYLVP